MEYIIVQAGGKGTRLKYLTENKPKALVPVDNLPMLFHLFNKYPDKKFIIIADYQKEVLRKYLAAFAKVVYQVVDAEGTGTCAGVAQALSLIPMGKPFMLVWSDLILPDTIQIPEINEDYIGISETFPCRWSYEDGIFEEKRSFENGVAGFFLFTDKSKLDGVPQSGELVRWMSETNKSYRRIGLGGTKEFGLIEEYENLPQSKCRPFNRVRVDGNTFIKEPIDKQGEKLAELEVAWYEKAKSYGIENLPHIFKTNPLVMELIEGQTVHESNLTREQKENILRQIVATLKQLHACGRCEKDTFSLKEAYYYKTIARIDKIRDLVPLADKECITINGKSCRNVFFYKRELESALEKIECSCFTFIHGDCTFSNIMLRKDGTPILIDPRGYFGYSKFYGDPLYDWAKLYYSIVGNYDKFNLKKFRLHFGNEQVELQIESNEFEELEEKLFELTQVDRKSIKLLHAIIWLSLSTYAWNDYDSVCAAFYNGLFYLEDVL